MVVTKDKEKPPVGVYKGQHTFQHFCLYPTMDLDFDIDDSFPTEPYDHLLSPEATRVSDVYWLNSQPPPALRDIILQAPKPPRES